MNARPIRLALLALAASAAAAQPAPPRYSEVRIHLPAPDGIARLAALGIVLDHAHVERTADGLVVEATLNARERERVERGSFPYEVLVDDLAATFRARPRLSDEARAAIERASAVRGFEFGSMAGFYTLDEMVAELDSLALLYPDLVSPRVSLGQSIEGRDVWMVKLSDNPGVDEGEPEVLYTALHHAREPQSMMTVLYFMYYLAEGYGTDPDVTALLNNREFYFVPMLNPDGYARNELTDPEGGGFWRKNRRDNGDGTFGVDLNRNYGYLWGLDDEGSSPWTDSETYRGTAPFSEPETAALRAFVEGREIAAALNFHSRGEEYLYPWGYAPSTYTPDDALFNATSADMAAENEYAYGTGPDVLYPTNGGSDDWMYGEQTTKGKILAWTAEVCNRTTDGFWPPMERIFPIAQENVRANLILARLAGGAVAEENAPPAPDADALTLSPNPAGPAVRLAFEGAAGEAMAEVHDLLGRRVLAATLPAAPAGRRTYELDVAALRPGVYVVSVTDATGRRLSRPLTRGR